MKIFVAALLTVIGIGGSAQAASIVAFTADPDPDTLDGIAPWTEVLDFEGDFAVAINNEFVAGAAFGNVTIGDATFLGNPWTGSGFTQSFSGATITNNSTADENLGSSTDAQNLSFILSSYRNGRTGYTAEVTGLTPGQAYKVQLIWGGSGIASFAETFTIDGVDVKPGPGIFNTDDFLPADQDFNDSDFGVVLTQTIILSDSVLDIVMSSPSDINQTSGIRGFTVEIVPEPGSLALLSVGGLTLLSHRRRDRSA